MYKTKIEKILQILQTSKNGLAYDEVKKRQVQNGKNEIETAKKQTFLKCFFKQFLNIMVVILLISAIVSITISLTQKDYGNLFEGFVILFIVIMNALIGVFQENKAQACLDELKKYNKVNVKVRRQGSLIHVDSTELVVGDIVEIESGNMIMADIRLIETNDFFCDESSLTGESLPVEKNANLIITENVALADRKNMAYSGSLCTSGNAVGVVCEIGKKTEFGKIANMLFSTKKEQTPLQKSIDKIGKIITWTVLAVCIIILTLELIKGDDLLSAFMLSVALAVAAIPESLPAVITIIMALGVQQLAKRKCIIKHLHAVETLGCCEVICSDKTGTLTMNKMQVVETVSGLDKNINDEEFLKCMKLCNSTKIEHDKFVGPSTEIALYGYATKAMEKLKFNCPHYKIVHTIPFNSTRKMSSVVINDDGLKSFTKGAPEYVLNKCKYVKINGKNEQITTEFIEKIKNVNAEMASRALRVIGFASKSFDKFNQTDDIENGMTFLGLAGLMDKPRPEVKSSIEKCFEAGLKPVMITGDHLGTAFAIAKELGIAKDESQVMSGSQIDGLNDVELCAVCKDITVFARVTPEHKVRVVKAYKNLNKIVAMTGDGVNDAPSLKIADIGVGMGQGGTDVVKSVADLVITDDNFASIVTAVEEGRKVYNNIQKALQFLISTNCVEVFGMLISLMFFPKYSFLLPAQMLYINLVTDSLPAFALGLEKVEPSIMRSPPRNSKSGLFSGAVGAGILYQSILQTILSVGIFVIGVFCYGPEVASTMVFFQIIFMQLLHSVNCKTNASLFDKNLFDNRTFNLCFLLTLVINLIVACVPFMYTVFDLKFLNFSQWLTIGIFAIVVLPACEICKLFWGEEKFSSQKNYKIKKSKKKLQKN